jgi:hypothetical protein
MLEKRKFDAENVKSTKESRKVLTSEIVHEVLHQHESGMKVNLHPLIVMVSWYFCDMK